MDYEIKYNIVEELGDNHQIISIEPLERGFGHTLGNALRRVMLGHLSGAAIVRVKIDGVQHEFSSLPGVMEDAVQLVQNLKQVQFHMSSIKTTIVTLDASGEGEVKAGDLKCPTGLEVVNKDLHIATLSEKKSKLKLELTVEYGRGYELPDETEKKPVGTILVDANYSPIRLVSYTVETTRVGRVTDLDRLVMDITTDGSVSPKDAIQRASAILAKHLNLLAGDTEVFQTTTGDDEDEKSVRPEKKVYLEELGLPTRVLNTLKKSGYETAGDIMEVGEEGLNGVKNIGPKTVKMLLKKVEDAVE
ncbi:DNA-directed RNA polymerase subunit alpha [candidate division WWE3 bacterium]|uniref:DNA-directed RNA polymerase subunit alpha n=1 Tax=candidate division WWE3 bacterium TaxID=2053526 RepID=A0A955LKJ6_UNCKA|nr:DNA-directed RNA polymerase subunit alpha [candidate division WWE3 bacterium]